MAFSFDYISLAQLLPSSLLAVALDNRRRSTRLTISRTTAGRFKGFRPITE